MVVLLLLLLLSLWHHFFCSHKATNSYLTLCSLSVLSLSVLIDVQREITCYLIFPFWTAIRVLLKVKYGICPYEHSLSTFSCFFFHCLFFLPVHEEKSVCCSERTPPFYSLSSFMVPICTILKVLILLYMQNIPVLQQKHVTKIRIKKSYGITLIFSEHCNVALLCASMSEAEKKPLK